MIYTQMTKKALSLCFDAHKNQIDKSGLPYVFHPFHLAEQMNDEASTIVALLHDVIEDTDYSFEDLLEMGFDEKIVEAIKLLTHDKEVPYMEYVKKIKENALARTVKIADLTHNSDLSRLDTVDEKSINRVKKYKEALAFLAE